MRNLVDVLIYSSWLPLGFPIGGALSQESVTDLQDWLEIVKRKITRSAEKNLAHLSEKATRLANQVSRVEQWFRCRIPEVAKNMGTFRVTDHEKEFATNQGEFRESMNFETMIALADELTKAKTEVDDLKRRKHALGFD